MVRHLVDILPGRIALAETPPDPRHFGADEAIAEAQRLALDIEQHELRQERLQLHRIEIGARRHGASPSLAVPVGENRAELLLVRAVAELELVIADLSIGRN